MTNYLRIDNDHDMCARERAYMHAGQALALFMKGAELDALPAFDATTSSTPTQPSDPFVWAVASVVLATSYDVDIAVYSRWAELGNSLSDHIMHVREGGHRTTAVDLYPAADAYLADQDWTLATFEQLMLHHWTAVSSVAELLLVNPTLALSTIKTMLEVDGPCVWAHYLLDDRGNGHEENCPYSD